MKLFKMFRFITYNMIFDCVGKFEAQEYGNARLEMVRISERLHTIDMFKQNIAGSHRALIGVLNTHI